MLPWNEDMSTAPRDGTRILLITILPSSESEQIELGHWPTMPIYDPYPRDPRATPVPIAPRWCMSDHRPLFRDVVAWQPLPSLKRGSVITPGMVHAGVDALAGSADVEDERLVVEIYKAMELAGRR